MTKVLLWVLFLNGFLVFFSWWGTWPMMAVGAASSLVAHIALAREETR